MTMQLAAHCAADATDDLIWKSSNICWIAARQHEFMGVCDYRKHTLSLLTC